MTDIPAPTLSGAPAAALLPRARADMPRMPSAMTMALLRLRPFLLVVAAMAGAGMALSALIWGGPAAAILLAASTTLGLIAAAAGVAVALDRWRRKTLFETHVAAAARDPDPILLTDGAGRCLAANPAAALATGSGQSAPSALLRRWCAEPERVIAAVLAEVLAKGHARRTLTRPESALHLVVHRTHAAEGGGGLLVWRFTPRAEGAARSLDMLGLPVLTLGPRSAVVAANAAFRAQCGDLTPGSAAADAASLPADLTAALSPLQQGSQVAPVVLPGPGGGQRRLALSSTGRDGQRDIVFLPEWVAPAGAAAPAGQRHDFEDIPVALVHVDGDGRIVDTNRPARGLLGLAPGETRHFWEVVEGLGRPVADWLEDAREGRALNRPEVLRATLPPQETYVQIILRRASGPENENALVAVVSDATELKSLEARFVQSQKMQAIGQLAGGVAHDFNNLLTAISGHCDLLLLNRDHYDPDYNDLVQIHQNTNRAAALVRQLLAFSRKQTLKPETLSVESLLEELAHLLTRLVGERITLTLSHDPRAGTIRADRRQLEQVVMNLVVNARDAMPMGGEITIETEAVFLSEEMERGRARLPAGRYAVIRVMDEGVGIPADIIDKIFEPFFTTKRTGEGTGLGLSTAYGIVKQMGGWIFAESTEGTGTEITLYFAAHHDETAEPGEVPRNRVSAALRPPVSGASDPFASEAAAAGAGADAGLQAGAVAGVHGTAMPARGLPMPAAAAPVGDGAVVLLVEDEAPVRAFAARALRLQGYHVIEAENGEQALEFLDDPAQAVDIFVSDVIMPGIDGPGWVSRALLQRPDTPVVFVSGYTEDGLSTALGRVPRSVFLGKPFSLQDLTSTIARQLARRN